MEKKVFFTIPTSKLAKIETNRPKWTSGKAYPKNYQKSQFFDHFGLPNPSQNPSKTFPIRAPETSWPPLGPSWALLATKPWKKTQKSGPRNAKDLAKPFQNSPKALPKTLQNQFKNACEKYIVFGSVFVTIFFNVGSPNHLFFNEFLVRGSIQISSIFGSVSPSQSITFWLISYLFEHRMQKMIFYKNMHFT